MWFCKRLKDIDEPSWNYDHGYFVPFLVHFPTADIILDFMFLLFFFCFAFINSLSNSLKDTIRTIKHVLILFLNAQILQIHYQLIFCLLFLLGCVCLYLLPRDSPPEFSVLAPQCGPLTLQAHFIATSLIFSSLSP